MKAFHRAQQAAQTIADHKREADMAVAGAENDLHHAKKVLLDALEAEARG